MAHVGTDACHSVGLRMELDKSPCMRTQVLMLHIRCQLVMVVVLWGSEGRTNNVGMWGVLGQGCAIVRYPLLGCP